MRDLAAFDDGDTLKLYAAMRLAGAAEHSINTIMRWDGGAWSTFAVALEDGGPDGFITDLDVLDDGSGPALVVSGFFDSVGGIAANNIARFDGGSWTDLGTDPSIDGVFSPVIFDPGTGPALHASIFTTASERVIMRRDGTAWTVIDGSFDGSVHRLAVYDDGTGAALFAGGNFTTVTSTTATVAANNIARFDGTSWSRLGIGLGSTSSGTFVSDLEVFDDGTGTALYASGWFLAASPGGLLVNHVARWNGSSWSALRSDAEPGITAGGAVMALHALGESLYALGNFHAAGGLPSRSIAAWTCAAPLFADGFESGDATAWSNAVP